MTTRRVLVVAYPGAELLDIACITTTLQMANHYGEHQAYAVTLAAPGGGAIRTATGLAVQADRALERVRGPLDTSSSPGARGTSTPWTTRCSSRTCGAWPR